MLINIEFQFADATANFFSVMFAGVMYFYGKLLAQ